MTTHSNLKPDSRLKPDTDSRPRPDTPYHQAQRYHFGEWVQRGLSAGLTPGQIAKALGRPLKDIRWLIEEEEEKRLQVAKG